MPILVVAGSAFFLATSFRAGWNHAGTDFPNYYTAAVLVTKNAPLHNFYNWTWFQKQMNYAGVQNQLGGYIPQTPWTMLPMLAVADLDPQTAKRAWLLLNLGFLGGSFWLLSQVTCFSVSEVCLLGLSGYGTLRANFLLGQYYVFLLFLLVLAFWCLKRQREYAAGLLLGAAFALKLYGGPLLLYFAVRRRLKPLTGMLLACACALAVGVMIFDWADIVDFVTWILPRAVQGETLDPYNSGNGTVATLLRRTFVLEPELNPHPFWNAPWLSFFLQPFFTIFVLALPLLCLGKWRSQARGFSVFYVALVLASPNTASYTFVLLLLPVALLMEEATIGERITLICFYVLVSMPIGPGSSWLFPKVWLLLALFVFSAQWHLTLPSRRAVLGALVIATVVAAPVAWRHLAMYRRGPGRRWEHVALQQGAIYSSSPAILRSGIVYESIGKEHYVLRWLHGGPNQEFAFAGEAFHPVARSPDGPIQFEMVAGGKSTAMSLDLSTGRLTQASSAMPDDQQLSATSPDSQWIAFTTSASGGTQLWLRKASGGPSILIAGGACNNVSPAWELDSSAVVFASDCDRGIGLPALYRAPLAKLRSRP